MKFGKTLISNQIPEWSRNYISYKQLKKEIKNASNEPSLSEETITSISFQLDRELEKVDQFFDYKQSFIHRRLCVLTEAYKDDDALDEILLALKDVRSQIDKLLWFSELNSKGFRKILKKLDKKLGLNMQSVYLETKVNVLPFANPVELHNQLNKVNEWISNSVISNHQHKIETVDQTDNTLKIARYKQKNQHVLSAIKSDNVSELRSILEKTPKDNIMLDLAVEYESIQCLKYFVSIGLSLSDHKDINECNLLHRLCIRPPSTIQPLFIQALLDLEPSLPLQKDFVGRRALHYAAESNHENLIKILLQHAIDNHYYSPGFSELEWQDRDGFTPLFYGMLHANTEGVKIMIELGQIDQIDDSIASNQTSLPEFARLSHYSSSVALACQLKNLELLKLLISKNALVNLADEEDGETPLMRAIKNQFIEGIKVLIDHEYVNLELVEKVNGLTALMIASIDGSKEIIELLLNAGANKDMVDFDQWTAADHAVFRGHLDIAKLLKPQDPTCYLLKKETKEPSSNKLKASRLYGHKYLTDHAMIIITLGSNDIRNTNPFIQLLNAFQNQEDPKRLSLSISAVNAMGDFPIIDLPAHNNQDPIVLFTQHKPEEVTLRFDLIETLGSSRQSHVLARGTSILAGDFIFSKSKGFKGLTDKASLRGQQTVPLVQAKDLAYVGTLNFEYFVVTPFKHDNMTIGDRYTYYRSVDTKVIGHRGSGMNRRESSKLQLGENTVLSFVTAASLGAEYVEFDVQLTKDLVPVIYHDWTVTETGYDIPLNAITLEQFLNLPSSGHIKEYHTGVSEGRHGITVPISNPVQTRRLNRSQSFSGNINKLNENLDQTRALGKMKGNGPETIQGPFTTLAETLKTVPKSIGFNIEVKYPMIDEAEQDELTQFQELNIYIDTILESIYDYAEQDRRIIFSSFHPEICLALNLKQPNYPVFFLTDAGTLPMADVRCNSLQGAVRFAKQANLLGIVAASEPILEAPRMVQVIQEMGLLLFTYGVLNNEVENAVAQKKYGVDAVIVDSVLPIRKGLRGD